MSAKRLKLNENEICGVVNFLDFYFLCSYKNLISDFLSDYENDVTDFYRSDDCSDIINENKVLFSLYGKLFSLKTGETEYGDEEYEGAEYTFTKEEEKVLHNIIEFNLLEMIREDRNIDNLSWVNNLITIWKKTC